MSLAEAKEHKLTYRSPIQPGSTAFLEGTMRTIGERGKPAIVRARIDLLRTLPGLLDAQDIDNLPFPTALDPATEDPAKLGFPKAGMYLYVDLSSRKEGFRYLSDDPKTAVNEINEMRLTAHEFMIRWQTEKQTAEEIEKLRAERIRGAELATRVTDLQQQVDTLRLELIGRGSLILVKWGVWSLGTYLASRDNWQLIPPMLWAGRSEKAEINEIAQAAEAALYQESVRTNLQPSDDEHKRMASGWGKQFSNFWRSGTLNTVWQQWLQSRSKRPDTR